MAEVRSILATDCGSTTTKAILIEKRGWRQWLNPRKCTLVTQPLSRDAGEGE